MFFSMVSNLVDSYSNMVVFDVPTKVGVIDVEINVIFVGVKVTTSKAKAGNGHHVKEHGYKHSTRKLKGVYGTFPIV